MKFRHVLAYRFFRRPGPGWAALFLALALLPAPGAITVILKDGSSATAETLTAQGSGFSLKPPGGGAARVIAAAQIERLEMDPPVLLAEVEAAYTADDMTRTLTALGKLKVELEPLKNIEGGREWWIEGEFLRAHILLSQKRVADVETSMKEIAANGSAAEKRHAAVFLAHLTALAGDPHQGLETLKSLILEARDAETLADAWLFTGQHRAAINEPAEALLAFMRVPVFYPERRLPLAAARLGAARCHMALEDHAAARRVLKELLSTQGTSAEGKEAKKLLTQVEQLLGEETAPSSATDAAQ